MCEIKQEVVKHFYDIFGESIVDKPCLHGVVFHSILKDNNIVLTIPFGLQELDNVMSQCNDNKSSGSDEFNFTFLKKFWNLVIDDLGIVFDQLHWFASLPNNLHLVLWL